MARLNVAAPGEGWGVASPLADRLLARADEPAKLDTPRCGEGVVPRELTPRRAREILEMGSPAPLLMRVARRKATLETDRVTRGSRR